MTFTIERGIPIPPKANRKQMYPLDDMKRGDSFFVKGKKADSLNGTIYRAAKRRPSWKFLVRTVPGGVRVWRVK